MLTQAPGHSHCLDCGCELLDSHKVWDGTYTLWGEYTPPGFILHLGFRFCSFECLDGHILREKQAARKKLS